jgi:hypothetical protein
MVTLKIEAISCFVILGTTYKGLRCHNAHTPRSISHMFWQLHHVSQEWEVSEVGCEHQHISHAPHTHRTTMTTCSEWCGSFLKPEFLPAVHLCCGMCMELPGAQQNSLSWPAIEHCTGQYTYTLTTCLIYFWCSSDHVQSCLLGYTAV